MISDEEIQRSIGTIDRQLLWNIYQELTQLNAHFITNENQSNIDSDKETKLDILKRPDLMKEMSKLKNKPTGFIKWETEKMREFLKEAK